MRAGEILKAEVYASDGGKVGHVFEIVADKSGPVVRQLQGRALVVSDLLVGARASLLRLGYKTREMKGPHGLRWLLSRFRGYRVPWDEVDSIAAGRIELRCSKDDLAKV
jgi:sporulation protein YlmC with PRC-barrel domain